MEEANKDGAPATPRVLVVTASVGAGHNSAARAIVATFRAAWPGGEINCVDVLDFVPRVFRACYAGGFALTMTRFPRIYGLGFRLTNRRQGPDMDLLEKQRLWVDRLALRQFQRLLLQEQPDVIINTHFLSVPMTGRLISRRLLRARQVVVITDIEVHRWWHSENVDHWFAPTEYSAETLRRWGADEDSITVSGIPIHPKWTKPLDRQEILTRWRLPADKRIVLLTGGTEFTCGPVGKVARDILKANSRHCVVVLCGRNKKLLAQLAKLNRLPAVSGRLFPVAFTDCVHELVEVCSLMVTKPGGITTAECLAKGKPMLLTRPVPGQEAGNARYLQDKGAARIIRSFKAVAPAAVQLLEDTQTLRQMGENARRLHMPAAETIVNVIGRKFPNGSAGRCAGQSGARTGKNP